MRGSGNRRHMGERELVIGFLENRSWADRQTQVMRTAGVAWVMQLELTGSKQLRYSQRMGSGGTRASWLCSQSGSSK